MKFWGVEVKSGHSVDVKVPEGQYLYVSQACLRRMIKGSKETIELQFIGDGEQRGVTLYSSKAPQVPIKFKFEKNIQISVSNTTKNQSVHFVGYIAEKPWDDHQESDSYSKDFDYEDEDKECRPPVAGKAKKEKKAYSIGACMAVLEATPGVTIRSYTKAVSFFLDRNWRIMFSMMSERRRKEWLDRLDE